MLSRSDLPSKACRIFIYGYFGGRNLGDELMLLGLIEELKKFEPVEISIVSPTGEIPQHLSGHVNRAYRKSLFGIMKGLWGATALVICGGTMFHDAYPDDRHRTYRKNLAFLSILCISARTLRRKVLLLGVGLGPFKRPLTKLATKIALKSATTVVVRDEQSMHDGLALGNFEQKIRRGTDLSHLIDYRPIYPISNGPEIIVSVVSSDLTSTASKQDVQIFHQQLAIGLAELARRNSSLQIIIIAIGVGRNDNDIAISRDLVRLIRDQNIKNVEYSEFSGNPYSIVDRISKAHAVIATRFHLAVLSESMGKNTLWIAYQRKLIDTAKEMKIDTARLLIPALSGEAATLEWIGTLG